MHELKRRKWGGGWLLIQRQVAVKFRNKSWDWSKIPRRIPDKENFDPEWTFIEQDINPCLDININSWISKYFKRPSKSIKRHWRPFKYYEQQLLSEYWLEIRLWKTFVKVLLLLWCQAPQCSPPPPSDLSPRLTPRQLHPSQNRPPVAGSHLQLFHHHQAAALTPPTSTAATTTHHLPLILTMPCQSSSRHNCR